MRSGLREALELQKEIYSSPHKLCITAQKILKEYAAYEQHWNASRKHIKKQKQLLKSKYEFHSSEIEKRDGKFCRNCNKFEKLEIDHLRPVSLGGITELVNLQFLCKSCNTAKSNRT